jgi:hypothetical protein
MEILIVWSVIAIITIVHILVFEFISKKYFSNLPRAINAILRGFVVGVCVNYFFFLILAFLSGSYFVMVSDFLYPFWSVLLPLLLFGLYFQSWGLVSV